MAIFNYKINKNNSFEIGQIEAENVELAKMLLTNTTANVVILSITKQYFDFNKFFATKLTSKELINFFSSISAMDKVGIDILTAMKLMKEQIAITPNLKKVCSKIYDRISSGDKLSIACKLSSKSFTDDYIH